MSADHVLLSQLECGPIAKVSCLRDETEDIQAAIQRVFVTVNISLDITLTRPKKYGTMYKSTNAYVIIKSDGLDPIFGRIMSFVVVASDFPIIEYNLCNVLYFDNHYFAYVIEESCHRDFVALDSLYDHNVYHGYEMSDTTL